MSNYTTPQAFYDVYYDFTGYSHSEYPQDRTAVAQDLARVVGQSELFKSGPLVVANSVGIYIYNGDKGHQLMSSASYRASKDSGFYEITGISHIGPAIAYLGALKELGDSSWENHLDPMIDHLAAVREINAAPPSTHWLTQLDTPIYTERADQIKKMIDYACSLAANYLLSVKNNKGDFCGQHIVDNFLNVQSNDYPISYDTVMIGTFAVVGLKSIYELYKALSNKNIDWANAKIILHNLAGTNYGAGVTEGSNWLVPVIESVAGSVLDPKRIIIMPYASLPKSLGEDSLSDDDFNMIASTLWGASYSRPIVSEVAFSHVEDIKIPYRDPLPGDYEVTTADQIEDFVKRLKFSITSPKQMLSNTVGFWLAGEAVSKKWQFAKMDLPGLTHGFPEEISAYPDNAPVINK